MKNMKSLTELQKEKILVSAWCVYESELLDDNKCKRIKDAGIDIVYYQFDQNRGSIAKILENCEKHGLGLMAFDSRITTLPADRHWVLPGLIDEYKTREAFYGFIIRDEPGVYDFFRLNELVKSHYSSAPDKIPGINLFPSYANELQLNYVSYEEYIDRYAREVATPYISYDFYPLYGVGDETWVQDDYLHNFEVVADACKKYGKDMWYFIQVLAFNKIVREPDEKDLRWQVYCALSFGVKNIQLFCYCSPDDGNGETFEEAMISKDGNKTSRYDYMRNVLQEIHLFDSEYLKYRHVGNMLYNKKTENGSSEKQIDITFPGFVRKVSIKGNYSELRHPLKEWGPINDLTGELPVMAGCFESLDGDKKAFTLVNMSDPGAKISDLMKKHAKSYKKNRISLSFNEPVKLKIYNKCDIYEKQIIKDFNIELESGQGIFVEIL